MAVDDGEHVALAGSEGAKLRLFAETLVAMNASVLVLVAQHRPLPEILEALVRSAEALAPGVLGSVLLVSDDGTHLRHGAAPSLPEAYNRAIDGIAIGAGMGS